MFNISEYILFFVVFYCFKHFVVFTFHRLTTLITIHPLLFNSKLKTVFFL